MSHSAQDHGLREVYFRACNTGSLGWVWRVVNEHAHACTRMYTLVSLLLLRPKVAE